MIFVCNDVFTIRRYINVDPPNSLGWTGNPRNEALAHLLQPVSLGDIALEISCFIVPWL